MRNYLFAYGTLCPPFAPVEISSAVRRLRPVGPGVMRGKLYDLGEYPGAVLDPKASSSISGELFQLPADPGILRQLDLYEGFNPQDPQQSLFVRQLRTATTSGGRRVRCWVYEYNGDPGSARLLTHGNYRRHRAIARRTNGPAKRSRTGQ